MEIPEGITVEQVDNQIIIRTKAKQFGLAEKIATAFFSIGLIFLHVLFFSIEISIETIVFSIIVSVFCLVILTNLIFINRKYQTIIISMDNIEIIENRIVFSSSRKIKRADIELIDLKEITQWSMFFSNYSFKIATVVMMNLGLAEIPRIRYRGNNVFFFEDCNSVIKSWIVNILNS